ncbi:MAG TPA: urease subunit beta [Segeticoccus sp.]|uniref:urease subunit beta n=1 Tax=Segeticoccus sp. TaxID=2706531 RepID=UPI002D7F8E2A|nr:urease subunit beta [Segeticoccus sp.]HET8599109.1 urease subunit beta [Segeticoccus sp.]
MPRRGGTGQRQAERRHYVGDQPATDEPLIPGEVLYGDDPVVINAGKEAVTLRVINTADRPIQVGSHYHFAEVNPALEFDRKAAWGRRLNVLSGGSVRFEPGATAEVELIPIGGRRIVRGLRGECGGALDA